MNTDLQQKIRDGFQASAFRGCTGQLPPAEQDDKLVGPNARFAQMISRKLESFPMPKQGQPPHEFGSYSKPEPNNNRTLTNPLNCTAIQPPNEPDAFSKTGVVPNGLNDSRGFLETTTTQQRFKGQWDPEVMQVYNEGRAKELQLEREREILKATPFKSGEPSGFVKSSSEHSNLSKVDRADLVYKSRHNLGGDNAAQNRQRTAESIAAGNAVDKSKLKQAVQASHDSTMPSGYRKPPEDPISTMKDHYCGFDGSAAEAANDRYSKQPACTKNLALTAEDRKRAENAELKMKQRNDGDYETESSKTFKDRLASAEVDKAFRKSNTFDVQNRVPVMKRNHNPRSDVGSGEAYGPHEIVPGQYKAMSTHVLPARD
jgi:hypothetical protein